MRSGNRPGTGRWLPNKKFLTRLSSISNRDLAYDFAPTGTVSLEGSAGVDKDVPGMDCERIAHYRREISRRSPPASRHDELMIEVYTRLLDSAMELIRMERAGLGQQATAP